MKLKFAIITIIASFAPIFIPLSVQAAESSHKVAAQDWSFDGMFGKFDKYSLQRGFQVYKEVCAACHSLKYVAYRDLEALGYNEAQIKAVASEYEVTDGPNDEGEYFQRPARPADKFVPPFENDNAARYANNGAYPADLSLMAKARAHGPDYIYALLTHYKDDAPAGFTLGDGLYYNETYAGNQIAMPQPLYDDQVTYQDGTDATVAQMSYDVTNFLMWSAEPYLEQRKAMGLKVIIFLIFFAGILYAHKRRLWRKLH